MTGRRRSTNSKLQQAETLFSLGLSNGEVAARLQCSTRTVRTYAQTLRGDGRIQNPINKGGRPRKITHRLERVLMREAMWGSTNTHGQLVRLLRESYGAIVLWCYCLCSSLFELKLGWKVHLYVRKTLVKFQLICNII